MLLIELQMTISPVQRSLIKRSVEMGLVYVRKKKELRKGVKTSESNAFIINRPIGQSQSFRNPKLRNP